MTGPTGPDALTPISDVATKTTLVAANATMNTRRLSLNIRFPVILPPLYIQEKVHGVQDKGVGLERRRLSFLLTM